MRDIKMPTEFSWEIPKGREHLRNPGIDRRIILKCILKKWYNKLTSSLTRCAKSQLKSRSSGKK
jgi:hypothetical protein